MERDKLILKFIKKVRRQLCSNIFFKGFFYSLAAGMIAWGVFNTIALFVPFYSAILFGLGAFVICLIAGCIISTRFYPSMERSTIIMDRLGLKERLTTSYGLKGKDDLVSRIQKDDTIRHIQKINIKKTFPFRLRKRFLAILFSSTKGNQKV